jgi:hypothetical protein
MANRVYDESADKEKAPISDNSISGNQTSRGRLSYDDKTNKDRLLKAENNETLGTNLAGNKDASGAKSDTSSGGNRSLDSDGLQQKESEPAQEGGSGLYNPEGDQRSGLFGSRKKSTLRNSLRKALKNKLLLGFVSGGAGLLIILIILISILIGAYKIVDFAEHIAAYQFARSTAQMAEDTAAINSEKIGLESIPKGSYGDRVWGVLKDKYTVAGNVSDLWSKLDNYRPGKILDNFNSTGQLKITEAQTGIFKRTYISGVEVNGKPLDLRAVNLRTSLANRIIPGYKFVNDVQFTRQFVPRLNVLLKAEDIGPITRARFAAGIRDKLGISLVAWEAGKYAGLSEEDAAIQAEKDAFTAAQGTDTTANPKVDVAKVNETAKQANDTLTADVNNPSKLRQIVNNAGQLPKDYVNFLKNAFQDASFSSVEGALKFAVRLTNPVYKWALPFCLIYEGSLKNSAQPMNAQAAQLQRTGVYVQSASAQEKDGLNTTGEAVGATNWKLKDINSSNAEMRANNLPVDTTNYQSAEASPTGLYSIADYGLGNTIGPIVDFVANKTNLCPIATNLYVGLGLGVLSLLISGGTGSVGDGAVDVASQSLGDQLVARIITTAGNAKSAVSDIFSWKTVAVGGGIAIGSAVAKQLVLSQTGAVHNSLATGSSYENDADSGTNIYANQIEQQQFYGAPLTDHNLAQENAHAQKDLLALNGQKSPFLRYVALSNPDSMASHLLMSASSVFSSSVFNSILRLGDTLLSPLRTLGSLISPMISQTTFAASAVTSVNTFYGNVQFGLTPYEHSLIQSDPSYAPLENQLALDKSGKEPEIATTYGKCFDGSETIGDMLANGDIVRKSNGDIVPDQGLCSPKNLGTANTKYHDLVFRWRVAQGYKNSLDQLSQTQDVTGSAATPPTSPQPTPTPSQNTQCTADFSAAPDLAPVAKNLVAACEQNFPKTETLLSPSLYPAPHNMIFVPSSSIPHGDPAATNKGTVHLNISYFRQHPTDVGVIVHEDTHVIQGYGSKFYTPQAPFWIVEGMADWVRNKLGYTDPANYHCGSGQTYLSGYNCGAVFLDYLSSYDSNFVQDAHNAIRQGGYSDTTFILQKTGSDLKTLYNKCLQSNCAGGSGL